MRRSHEANFVIFNVPLEARSTTERVLRANSNSPTGRLSLVLPFFFLQLCVVDAGMSRPVAIATEISQAAVRISFTDAVTGVAVAPARIRIWPAGHGQDAGEIGDGLPSVLLRPGSYTVEVTATGYEPIKIHTSGDSADPQRVDVPLKPLIRPERVQVATVRSKHRVTATFIAGYVTDLDNGVPLSGADVAIAGTHALVQGDGYFELYAPASDELATLTVSQPGYENVQRSNVRLWSNGDWVFTIRAPRRLPQRTYNASSTSPQNTARADGGDRIDARASSASTSGTLPLPEYVRVGVSGGVVCPALDDYVISVLANEWLPEWNQLGARAIHAYRAGAVAIRSYAIGFVRNPLAASYDICGTTSCQVYVSGTWTSSAAEAVSDTTGQVIVNASGDDTRYMTEFARENNNLAPFFAAQSAHCADGQAGYPPGCVEDPVCKGSPQCVTNSSGARVCGHGRGMCQFGSIRWAMGFDPKTLKSHGYGTKDWLEIVEHYYPLYSVIKTRTLRIGDHVGVRGAQASPLKVRECSDGSIDSGVNCAQKSAKTDGAEGTVVGGPELIDSDGQHYTWWRIRWSDDSITGWSAENWLDLLPSNSGDADIDVRALQNTTLPVQWFYIATGNPLKWYIVSNAGLFSTNPTVMLLSTVDPSFPGGIRWKPINNADAFAGFPAAGATYSSVSVSFDGRSVSFGTLRSSQGGQDAAALAGTTQPVYWCYISLSDYSRWYIVDATDAFTTNSSVLLLSSVDTSFSGGIRWRPVNNYPEYAGFPAAADNFDFVFPSFDGRSVVFGGATTGANANVSLTYGAGPRRGGDLRGSMRLLPAAPPGVPCYPVVGKATPPIGGEVAILTPANCGSGYSGGTIISVTALPTAGFDFVHWESTNCALNSSTKPATACTVNGIGAVNIIGSFASRVVPLRRRRAVGHQ